MSDPGPCREGGDANCDGADPPAPEADGGVERARMDQIFEALTDQTRRFVLYYLRDHEVVSVDDLAREVAAVEAGIPPDGVSEDERERAATRLVHNHLPRLEDARFIEYDPRNHTIRYTEPPAFLDIILRLLAQFEKTPYE